MASCYLFRKGNFGLSEVEVWKDRANRKELHFKPDDISDMRPSVIVNGFDDMRSAYGLKRAYGVDPSNDDYEVDSGCTMLEFELSWAQRFRRARARIALEKCHPGSARIATRRGMQEECNDETGLSTATLVTHNS
ncbi:hypothetical protein [Bradyrhizobium sp. WSM1417]|uniref:hypothetical protein n=1 Tax=Bradyrhizobium sp. WSM1417 TaxID=754500 RepID=UPI0004894F94|nr:hypothetical protein [Bradyrhizobium sp. WSM1417]